MTQDFYLQMLNTLQEGIYFVNKTRQITFWNKGAEKITGFTQQEVVGSYCYDNILNHIDESGNHLCFSGCPLQKTLEDCRQREALVYLHHKAGYRVPVQVKVMPLYGEDGDLIGAAELFVDESNVFGKDLSDEELKAIAFTDALTHVANRRSTEHQLQKMQKGLDIDGVDYAIAMMDIDFFKRVNDTYGHNIGDEVLKMVAQTLSRATRSIDFVGRWGGEEFIMLFPGLTHTNLLSVLEKVRNLVEASVYRFVDEQGDHKEIHVTISIGGVVANFEESIESAVDRADKLLYISKQAGRNRVTVATDCLPKPKNI